MELKEGIIMCWFSKKKIFVLNNNKKIIPRNILISKLTMSANSIKLARRKTLPHPHDTPYSRKACSEMIEQYLEASIVFPSACEQFEDLKTEFLQRKEAAGGNSLFVGMDSREAPAARGNGCLRPAQIERRFTTSKWIR